MRLINTDTGLCEEFFGRKIPKYAILSHTWGKEEISLGDMSDPSRHNWEGHRKIAMTCQIANQAGLSYAWVDTCCIDKSSSAELTEAINSMYLWYQRSEVCYAYLSDLPASTILDTSLQNCRWFTRGWTLQELIAPRDICFLDQDWNVRGSKRDLVECLSKITGIDKRILQHAHSLASVAVAQKMSRAAHRETTRIEDTAYCLLGIFDVNMPLLYGEEEKAFRRLQEEIIRSTADLSIFAWRLPAPATNQRRPDTRVGFSGVLAESSLAFSRCLFFTRRLNHARREFSISNNSIKTRVQILSEPVSGTQAHRYVLPLDCSWDSNTSLGVRLRKCGPDEFVREDPWTLLEHVEPLYPNAPRERCLLTRLADMNLPLDNQCLDMSSLIGGTRSRALQIRLPPQMGIYDAWPWGRFDDEDQLFFVQGDSEWDSAALRLNVYFTMEVGRRKIKADFECMFYAVGWSSPRVSHLQFALVEYRSFASSLNEVQSQIAGWDHNKSQLLELLIYHKIPKSSSAVFQVSGTEQSALVSFKPTLVSDPKACRNKFWRVEFSYEVYKTENLPQIHCGQWRHKT